MSGGADLLDFSHDIDDALVGDVCLRFLIGKQFGGNLDLLSLVVHRAGAIIDPLDPLACGVDGGVAWLVFGGTVSNTEVSN